MPNTASANNPKTDVAGGAVRRVRAARGGAPNGFGLYNVCGNVWEWCADAFDAGVLPSTRTADPAITSSVGRRAMRGGSFLCHDSYCNRYRVAARGSNTPDSAASNIGFRVVR